MSKNAADRPITLVLTRAEIMELIRRSTPFLIDHDSTPARTKLLRALDEDERKRVREE